MAIIGGIFFVGLGIYVLVAPNDWDEGEWVRYNPRTRKSSLHPSIGGPLVIVIGIGFVIAGILSGIQDTNKAQATRDAQNANTGLSNAFNPIMADLSTRAQAQPGVMMTLTPGDRERAGVSEDTAVYYGWCTVEDSVNPFYIIVQNWNGQDYQRGFPGMFWGTCGGSPIDFTDFLHSGSQVWIAIRPGSFDYESQLALTVAAPTAAYEQTQSALTETARSIITPTVEGN